MHQKLNETSIRLIDLIVSVGCARRNFDLSHGCDSYRGKSFSFQTSSCFMSQHGKSQINHWSTSSPKSLAPLSTSIAAFRNRAYIDAALEQNVIVGGFRIVLLGCVCWLFFLVTSFSFWLTRLGSLLHQNVDRFDFDRSKVRMEEIPL